MNDRWELFVSGSAIHHDWRSPHFTTSSSPFGLGRMEMKKTTKKTAPKSETQRDAPIIVGGVVLPPREHDDFIGRDPRSVR